MPRPVRQDPPRSHVDAWLARLLLCAAPALAGCPAETATSAATDASEATAATVATEPASTDAMSGGSTAALPTTTSEPSPTSTDEPGTGEPSTGEPCPLGAQGCACDGDACEPGLVCLEGTCAAASCGDGVVQPGEQCDDANNIDEDGCTGACALPVCGDGIVGPGEGCDDGNAVDGDGCDSGCKLASCGDGVVQAGEQCDDGNVADDDACLGTCVVASCGDGHVQVGVETCDDGNAADDDACLGTCVVASCGDGHVQAGVEQCDDGNDSNADTCVSGCKQAACGDGHVGPGEGCDDGNLDPNDGCTDTCKLPSCGDGVIDPGEPCDDGNVIDTDECTNACALAVCGDGVVHAGVEACDDGNAVDGDACLGTCALATCGDGHVWVGVEQCDDGNADNSDACVADCKAASCGDGFVGPGEGCDDGNKVDGDGCTNACKVPSCGDGELDPGEACDDGNALQTDACTNSCKLAACGDGLLWAGQEACDDGNNIDTDACTGACVAASCGDGFVWAGHEACDDGNLTDGDGCDADCTKSIVCGDGIFNFEELCWVPQPGFSIGTNALYDRYEFGDVDGDGHTDLLIANFTPLGETLYWGASDGTFTKAQFSSFTNLANTRPKDLALGDFDNDGDEDVAILYHNSTYPAADDAWIGIRLSSGLTRTFSETVTKISGFQGEHIEAGRWHPGGNVGLAYTLYDQNFNSNYIGISPGLGDGKFLWDPDLSSSGLRRNLRRVDLDGDGTIELWGEYLNLNTKWSDYWCTPANNGTTCTKIGTADDGVRGAIHADWNEDGWMDAIGHDGRVIWGLPPDQYGPNMSSPFAILANFGLPWGKSLQAAVDANLDGHMDVVHIHLKDLVFRLGNGDGTFQPPVLLPLPFDPYGETIGVVDANVDGVPDFVFMRPNLAKPIHKDVFVMLSDF